MEMMNHEPSTKSEIALVEGAPFTHLYLKEISQMSAGMSTLPTSIWRYHSLEEMILKEGKQLGKKAILAEERGKLKQCFKNAYEYSIRNEGVIYMEGFANFIMPVHHAWCYDPKEDIIIETTWKSPGDEYVGIPCNTYWLQSQMMKYKVYGAFHTQHLKQQINLISEQTFDYVGNVR